MSLECSRSMITQTHFLPAHDLSIQLTPSSWYSLRVRPSSLSKAFNGLKREGLRSVDAVSFGWIGLACVCGAERRREGVSV